MLSFDIKIVFEDAGPAHGEICKNCKQEIKGTKYAGLLQFGYTTQLNIKDLNFILCEECKKKWS